MADYGSDVKNVTKKRLHFGVVFPSLDNAFKYDLLTGINEYAQAHDIHLTAYFGAYVSSNYDFASHYEPCFESIKVNNSLDGLIIFAGFIAHNIGTEQYEHYISSISDKMPVVSIALPRPDVTSVVVDNEAGTYKAIDHLIKRHGKKKIAFIKGPDGHAEAEARLRGYKNALSDNGIPLDENYLLPGSFTPTSGLEAMIELLDVRKIPFDAIGTSDDEAALGAMKELKDRGISVPKDVAVVGFDDVEEAARHVPSLSSVRQDFMKLGVIAIEMLSDIVAGKRVKSQKSIVPRFVARRSCGCAGIRHKKEEYVYEASADLLLQRRIADNLVLLFDIDSLADELYKALPQTSINTALVGLYRNQIVEDNVSADRTIDTLIGFDGKQRFNVKHNTVSPIVFSDYSTIDGFDFERERRTLMFLPLFFADEEAGIALLSYDAKNPVNTYETLRRNISTAVRGAGLLSKIRTLSITDELTGLLNRRGFFQFVHSRLLHLKRQMDFVPVVLIMDMDGLKSINDTYGHTAGDVAISTYASILKKAMREEDIIGRIGGDEFMAFTLIKSEDNIYSLVQRIRGKFDEYNEKKLHPFNVVGSIGAVVLSSPTKEAFEEAMQNADDVLYKEKIEKKEKGLTRS